MKRWRRSGEYEYLEDTFGKYGYVTPTHGGYLAASGGTIVVVKSRRRARKVVEDAAK